MISAINALIDGKSKPWAYTRLDLFQVQKSVMDRGYLKHKSPA